MPARSDQARTAIINSLLGKRFGITVREPPERDDSVDIHLVRGQLEVPMTVRSLGATSRVMVESAVVHVAARRAATKSNAMHFATSGICLLVETVSESMPAELCELLAGAHLPRVDLILAARRGRSWVDLPSMDLKPQWIEDDARPEHRDYRESISRNVFTSANLSVFKAILYHGLKEGFQQSDRWKKHPCRSGTDLKSVCTLSLPTITRALQSMEQRGWISWNRGERIRCLQPELAMTAWIEHARVVSMHRDRLAVVPVYDAPSTNDPASALAWLENHGRSDDGASWAVTGWHAVERHHLRFVASLNQKIVTVVTTEGLTGLYERWKVVPTHPKNALFVIIRDKDENLQAAAERGPGDGRLRWVDVFQSALEVAEDPMQGQAQAEAIADRLARSYSA